MRVSRRILLAVSLLLIMLLPTCSLAQSGSTVELTDVGLEITIPSGYLVLTRESEDMIGALELLGIPKDEIGDYFEQNNIYLDALPTEDSQEIVIMKDSSQAEDFSTCSDTLLSVVAMTFMQSGENSGIHYSDYDILPHAQTKFVRLEFNQTSEDTAGGLVYFTVQNGNFINILIKSYSGMLSENDKQQADNMIMGIHFLTDADMPVTETVITEPFAYSDDVAGVKFTIPANWEQTSLSSKQKMLKSKFTSVKQSGTLILYGNVDIWGNMIAIQRYGLTRADIDQDYLSGDAIELYLPVTASESSTAEYGGHTYSIFYTSPADNAYATELAAAIPIISAVRVYNGYWYLFQFSGTKDDPLYSDFESVLTSAEYSPVDTPSTIAGTRSAKTPPEETETDLGGALIISLFLTIVVYSLPIIIYRYAVRKAPVEAKKARLITIGYGVVAFILVTIISYKITGSMTSSGAILLWSWINYAMLTGGQKKAVAGETGDEPSLENPPDNSDT